MTVCRYYLQGTCRFGNRCRFEHVDPSYSRDFNNDSNYSNRRNDYGYQDRYRSQENFQDRGNKNVNPELSFGPRRYNNFEKQNQNYRSQNYNQYDNYGSNYGQSQRSDSYAKSYYKEDYGKYDTNQRYSSPERQGSTFRHSDPNNSYDSNFYKDDYGRYTTNQRYSSPERQTSNSRYDNSFPKGQSKLSDSSQFDKKKYEWVSDDYKKHHQKKEQTYQQTPKYQSNKTFSFKDSDSDKNEDINEENMILVERIKEDITSWELGNQWPFTCYSPLPKKGDLPGFSDISFEELRYEALQAEENNSFNYFVENINKALLDVQNRRSKLKEPTEELLSTIEKLRAGEFLMKATETKDFVPLMNFTQTVSEDIADEIPLNTQSSMSASSFSFKTSLDKDSPMKTNTSASFSFKTAPDQTTSASSFTFKVPETDKLPSTMFSSKDLDVPDPIYTPMDQLSEQDKEQFSASTFTLGKIPTVPPPKVFCF
ncbi:nucleoporin NUP42 [Parasteatoda tepidariorum]|uniref:nucleoporin NUP42 n=1 Tax=Parasteatoda tepidariorum TaxID=114398 RepID=UPI00077F9EB1|nr:nucleoporin NUP42 [Parasteatoda tepidariorum]